MNENMVMLARILYNFDIELDPSHEVSYGVELITKAVNDIKLKLMGGGGYTSHLGIFIL